jgi:TPR repeat protein
MGPHAKPLRATLTSLLMLVALAEAAVSFDGSAAPNGDFPLEEARTAYQRGNYATAYRLLKALGVMYDVPQDVAQGVAQFARLHGWRGPDSRTPAGLPDSAALEYEADQGYLPAQWKLGRMYAAGDGVPKDDQRAFTYFSQIANTHPDEPPGTVRATMVADAFVALGHYYLKGIPNTTVAPDAVRARDMFTYAASYFGDADAQYQLGRLRRATRARRRAGSSWRRPRAIAAPRRCWATCCSRASTCRGRRRAV